MNMLATILSLLLLPGAYAARPATLFGTGNIVQDFGFLHLSGQVLQQTAVGSDVADEDKAEECQDAQLGANLEIKIGEVLRTLNTSSIILCREECQSTVGCTTYRRSRSSGSCELINATRAEFEPNPESDFDIGGLFQEKPGGRSSDATGVEPNPDCGINRGITYPNGDLLARGYTPTVEHCCERCRADRDCNSWYFRHRNNRNKRCVLNRDIPSKVEADSSKFSGETV